MSDTIGKTAPVAVGLIGAGPWASLAHAPVLAASPHTTLVGIWARRPEAASELAARHGAVAFDTVEELFDACEAVAFAVPPDVQSQLAVQAALAGKHLLLEKPIAGDLAGAEGLAEAVAGAGSTEELAIMVRAGGGHPLDVHRGLHLQRILTDAEDQMT